MISLDSENSVENMLLIGNGFDLAHGFPTQYNSFLGFVEQVLADVLPAAKSMRTKVNINDPESVLEFGIRQIHREGKHTDLIWCAKDNYWITHFSQKDDRGGYVWTDFETEISNIVQKLDLYYRDGKKSRDVLEKILHFYVRHRRIQDMDLEDIMHWRNGTRKDEPQLFNSVVKYLEEDLRKLAHCLELYLSTVINCIPISFRIPVFERYEFSKVISFNYTNTFQRLYDSDQIAEMDYIHGVADAKNSMPTCNLVLGIDEYSEDVHDTYFIRFKKYFQRIHKRTGCQYKSWIQDDIRSKNLFVYGHSLDITDRDVLRDVMLSEKTKTVIFYYNQEEYAKQIANLVKVLGKDVLIDGVYGMDRRFLFQDIDDIDYDELYAFLYHNPPRQPCVSGMDRKIMVVTSEDAADSPHK